MSLKAWKLEVCSSSSSASSSTPLPSSSSSSLNPHFPERKPPKSSLSLQLQRLQKFSSPTNNPSGGGDDRPSGSISLYQQEQRATPHCPSTAEEDEEEDTVGEEGRGGFGACTKPYSGFLHAVEAARGPFEPLVLSSPGEPTVVQVPASINCRLLEHQRVGVLFLYNLYKNNHGGVLGDDMGLGKTIQTIAFLAAVIGKDAEKDVQQNEPKGNSTVKGPVLIICPTSVIQNWGNEFSRWGSLSFSVYHGPNRDMVLDRLLGGSIDILITSFDTFRIQGDMLCEIQWDVVIVDEAHRLKNEKSRLYKACLGLKTRRRFGLTGTIMQNKILELFNLLDWVSPGSLGTREHFRDYYDDPLKHGQRSNAPERFIKIADERKQHLSAVLRKYLLRRTKEETIGHLMLGKEDNVVFCAMSELQKRVYRRMLEQPEIQSLINKDRPCACGSPLKQVECCKRTVPSGILWSYLHRDNPDGCDSCPFCLVLPCIIKLQQISNHLELIKPNPKDEAEKQKKDAETASVLLDGDASLIGGSTQSESFMELSDVEHCGKMRALEKLIFSWISHGDKILLFSYSVRMLDILEKFMIRKGYCFSRLDGSTPMSSRQSLVDEFNNCPSKRVFLISTRAGGLGLNLVSANRVVIFDPNWNPAQDLQAQDRSFRYGQKRHVVVFRLLAAGSVEELVYSRQVYKQQLSNIAVSGKMEKRYFEGVQDCKEFQGELFGICNLFRDLSEKLFTSDIIEMHEKHGQNQIDEKELNKPLSPASNSDNDLKLADLGIVYAHRNEDVVNMGSNIERKDNPSFLLKEDLLTNSSSTLHSIDLVTDAPWKITNTANKKKRREYLLIAQSMGMSKLEFSRWVLSLSTKELQEVLQKHKKMKSRSKNRDILI